MAERKTVVTLHKGVDSTRFLEDMTAKKGDGHIPDRSVEVYNEKEESVSNFDFVMSMDEAEKLRYDPRVRGVRWGTKKECGIQMVSDSFRETRQYQRFSGPGSDDLQWGIPAMSFDFNPFISNNTLQFRMGYTADGTGVDIVISDDGLNYTHPELLGPDGFSRVQLIDWPSEANMPGSTQASNYYTNGTRGHGMHCASIASGNTYGWAPGAQIYNMISLENTAAFGASESLNLIKNWHLNKPNTRPTVVNASWGYFRVWPLDKEYHWYRGTQYFTDQIRADQGMVDPLYHPQRVVSIDSDVEDMIAAGIHIVSSAGNFGYKMDVSDGLDYDNFYRQQGSFDNYYWHRGASPAASDGAINVGAVDSDDPGGQEQIVYFTNVGPRIDVFAPGDAIQGALDAGGFYDTEVGQPYGPDPSFRCGKLSGSSFAAPQVAGIIACYLELHPTATPAEVRDWVKRVAIKDRLLDAGSSDIDYETQQALLGAPNNYAVQPYRSGNPIKFSGDVSYTPV